MNDIMPDEISEGRRVERNIWCVGAGESSSRPVRLPCPSFARRRCL